MTSDIAIKADSPIRTKEEDLLGRDRMAASVAEMINRSFGHEDAGDESLVAGIEGEWGSGKTSFINLVLKNLESSGREHSTIKFNPWNFSDQNELITDFFNSVAGELKRPGGEEHEKGARKIREYCSKLLKRSELRIEPKISIFGVEASLGGIYKTGEEEPLEKQKEAINELLKGTGKRFVIVIDDIDRLDARETRLVFKLVRMTANFANTVFLLAYDRDKVGKRITEKGIKGEEFLKKIVQLSFPLPRVDQRDLFGILRGELDKIIKDFDATHWDDGRWRNLFNSGFKQLFPTVRDIRRYVNGLRLDLEIVSAEEVNPVDFLGMEAIRIFAPAVYFAMAAEKRIFAFPAEDEMDGLPDSLAGWADDSGVPDPEARKDVCEEIIEKKSPKGLADAVRGIVKQLFPQVEQLYSEKDGPVVDDPQGEWSNRLRVCSGDVFDKYFSLAVVSGILSEKSLNDFLSTVEDVPVSVEKLRKFEKEGKSRLVLARLFDRLDDLDRRLLGSLLAAVFEFDDEVKDTHLGGFDPDSVDSQAWKLARRILERIEKEKRAGFLTEVLDSTGSVFSPAKLAGILNREIEAGESGEPRNEVLLTKEEVRALNDICAERIRNAAEDGSLVDIKDLPLVLYRWKEFESAEAVRAYAAELLKTEEGLFSLIRGFVSEAHSPAIGDSVQRITRMINRNALGEFADLDELDRLVCDLDERALSPKNAELLELYKNPTESF